MKWGINEAGVVLKGPAVGPEHWREYCLLGLFQVEEDKHMSTQRG